MKKCEAIFKPVNSFKTRKCGKKAILHLEDISDQPFGRKDLYLCVDHAHHILKVFFEKKK